MALIRDESIKDDDLVLLMVRVYGDVWLELPQRDKYGKRIHDAFAEIRRRNPRLFDQIRAGQEPDEHTGGGHTAPGTVPGDRRSPSSSEDAIPAAEGTRTQSAADLMPNETQLFNFRYVCVVMEPDLADHWYSRDKTHLELHDRATGKYRQRFKRLCDKYRPLLQPIFDERQIHTEGS